MFLATDRVLQVGSTIRLELELPNLGGERAVRCRVVYIRDRQAAERSGKPEGMGLQFLDLDEEALSQIGRFIADKSVEALENASEQRRASLSVLVVDDDSRLARSRCQALPRSRRRRSAPRPTASTRWRRAWPIPPT